MTKKLYLFDIEGTTTDIDFVHKVLFPYAQTNLSSFVLKNQTNPSVIKIIEDTKVIVHTEEAFTPSIDQCIEKLLFWIKTDRKIGPLKELQGLIWDVGYKNGDFKGHLYSDVKPFFDRIKEAGNEIGIYSSGSVHAQKLIFGYSVNGDLTPMISYYFDTKIGGKREAQSYKNIIEATKYKAEDIIFFSDIYEENLASSQAGMKTYQLLRYPQEKREFEMIGDFEGL